MKKELIIFDGKLIDIDFFKYKTKEWKMDNFDIVKNELGGKKL